MRSGKCTEVLNGDTIVLESGGVQLRYTNVWAPMVGTPLGDSVMEYNKALVLSKVVHYVPNGHIHWDNRSIIADVYLDGFWVNQELRSWLSRRMEAPEWVAGIPGADNKTHQRKEPSTENR